MSADLILCNLKALTFAPVDPDASLIAIENNRILQIGPQNLLSELRGSRTRVLDCQGAIAVPGFNDAHCHPLAYAVTLRHADCSAARCIDDIQAVLRKMARESARARWIRGANYEVAALAERRPLNRWDLDRAVPDLPVVLVERAGQHCVLNSQALALCGIDAVTAAVDAGRIHLDTVAGQPNGMISGNHRLVASAIPPLAQDEMETGLRQANREYLAAGITSLQDASWSNGYGNWRTMQAYKGQGLVAPRVTLFAGFDALAEFTARGMKTGSGDAQLRLGAAKIALDESSNDPDPPQAALDEAALTAHLAGFQLAFHVPDIQLLQRSLQALEFVRQTAPTECLRPRFEHCPVCPPELLPVLAQSGATVSTQPNLLYATGPRYLREVPPAQWPWLFPLKSFLSRRIPVVFGSDSPLTPCDALRAIHTAVTRTVDGGATLLPEEGIPIVDALRLYTQAGAQASQEEREKGTLRAGQLADLALLDPTALKADGLREARVLLTIIDGKVVWER